MSDTFYDRLDFYRMLNAGMTNLAEIAVALQVSIRTLQRWKASYHPDKGPYGSLEDISVRDRLGSPHVSLDGVDGQSDLAAINGAGFRRGSIGEILWALRRAALEGNVPAAKLLLSEYQNQPPDGGDVLTVEGAIQLLGKWSAEYKDQG